MQGCGSRTGCHNSSHACTVGHAAPSQTLHMTKHSLVQVPKTTTAYTSQHRRAHTRTTNPTLSKELGCHEQCGCLADDAAQAHAMCRACHVLNATRLARCCAREADTLLRSFGLVQITRQLHSLQLCEGNKPFPHLGNNPVRSACNPCGAKKPA